MTTIFKKTAALFALVAVVLAGVVVAAPAYAVGTGKLTVTSSDAGFNGAKVDAWQMFTATKNGSTYTFEVVDSWKDFFTNTAEGYPSITDDKDFNANASDYVRNLGKADSDKVTKFAKKAAKWAKDNSIPTTKQATATASGSNYTATFSGLDFGYYLVKPYASGEKDGSTRGTDAMLISVVDENATITLKNTYPTVDKKVENSKGNGAQVGDKVTFTLTSKVPDTSEFDHYTFKLLDTMSQGLTFNGDAEIAIGSTKLAAGTDYTVTPPSTDNNNTVTFDLSTYIKPESGTSAAKAGDTITVTYSATLNEKAETSTTGNGNTNSAKVQYTNGPNTTDFGESTPSETHTYTFGFDLKKVDGDNQALAGAKFSLYKKGSTEAIQFVTAAEGAYRVATNADAGEKVTEVETPENGIIKFTGLDDGEYTLKETQAPTDYNKAADTEIKITAKYRTDGTLDTWTVTNKGNDGFVTIVNRKGTLLPSTGGMGTIVFTVAGAAVVIAGVAWTIARRRAQN